LEGTPDYYVVLIEVGAGSWHPEGWRQAVDPFLPDGALLASHGLLRET